MAGPATYIAVGGSNKLVSEAYIAVGGQYKQVQTAELAVGGSNKSGFDPGITVNEWSLTPVPGNAWQWDLVLSLSNVTKAVVYGSWRSGGEPLATLTANTSGDITWTSRRGPATPGLLHEQWVQVFDTFNRKTQLTKLAYTPPSPPKPPAPTFSNIKTTSFTATGQTSVSVDSYQWQRVSPGTWTSPTTYPVVVNWISGVQPGTRYGIRYRYIMNGVGGPWSNTAYVTSAQLSYTKGNYTLYPTGHRSYNPGYNTASYYWRPTSEGIRAGNSSPWYKPDYRGNQRGYIFYNYSDSTHATLRTALSRGARVTAVKMYLRRRNTSHGYGGYDPRARLQIQTHGHSNQPPGRPGAISNWNSNHGFSRGEGKWISLPTWMGKNLIDGTSGTRGLSVGGYYSPYYLFEGVGYSATGRVIITIQ